jgi:acetylornithine deacetylase/succinyl-diaminopimelate desuccinylase-like protein
VDAGTGRIYAGVSEELERLGLDCEVDEAGNLIGPGRLVRAGRPPRIWTLCLRAVPELAAYLELHIEQGPMLADAGRRLGIVESVTGVLGFHVAVTGEANPLAPRRPISASDALAGAARMVLALREHVRGHPDLRAIVGRISVTPGAITVIPGECRFTVDLRPSQPEVVGPCREFLETMVQEIADDEGLTAEVVCDYAPTPTPMAPRPRMSTSRRSAWERGRPRRDGRRRARPGGHGVRALQRSISHSRHEWTETEDCELGARVLVGAIRRLAS